MRWLWGELDQNRRPIGHVFVSLLLARIPHEFRGEKVVACCQHATTFRDDSHEGYGLVHFRGHGRITYPYLVARIRDVNSDPHFRPVFSSLIDFVDAHVVFDEAAILDHRASFVDLQARRAPAARWAILTENDHTFFNAVLAHKAVDTCSIAVEIFRKRTPALAWLGLSQTPGIWQ